MKNSQKILIPDFTEADLNIRATLTPPKQESGFDILMYQILSIRLLGNYGDRVLAKENKMVVTEIVASWMILK